ncbi:hypothetical protein H5410_045275 [Solanum commersonii]|uniref:Uncharacterized protein n=1 Tax=Solanum commersonii TaxID=4109 RepID=A0A9J5X931_SOLCO|nr:hypothetical protein H5410_045275 [Solanum commersonii]
MDSNISTVTSSEPIPTSSVAANLNASIATKSPTEQTQSASLTYSTQDTPLVYTFAPPKAPTVTHHAPPVYTYATAPHITKAQEFHRQDVDHYVEIENDAKSIEVEMINRKMKSLEDAMRGLRGFDSSHNVKYEKLCTLPEVELPPGYKIPNSNLEYNERMVTMGGKTFVEVIKAGEIIGDDLKTGRITSFTSSHFDNRTYQTGSLEFERRMRKKL